jgi:hypothetical protein
MPIKIANDARPQVRTLLVAVALSVLLWFIPFAEVLTYPFRLFVTFIHEGGHALAAILTGNSVHSLSVHLNGSGEVISTQGGFLSNIIVSSAGYLGAMLFGALLLVAVRRSVAARFVLTGFRRVRPRDDARLRLVESVYAAFRHHARGLVARRRKVCESARRIFPRQLPCGAVCAECDLRPQDGVLHVVAVCA